MSVSTGTMPMQALTAPIQTQIFFAAFPPPLPQPHRNSGAIIQYKMHFFVGSGQPRGEPSCGKEVEQQDSDNLVEAFEDVGAAAREGGAFEFRKLQH